jgi:hypothetical protein
MNLEFSRRLALLGIVPPIADTIRRWHQLGDIKIWPFWLDDFFLGGFLLYWGFACGMVYISFFDQITSLDKPDPAPIPSVWVAVIKGVFFFIAILGLIGSLWGSPRESGRN